MSLRGFVTKVLPWTAGRQTIHECRHCGTVVDPETVVCPTCDRQAIARYELP
ncbi:hypothetical protein [Halorientalis sp. IM1011]|uniref:hypothetical protein n=1 Tax=Halorientalis sp. IM1011 TaxID=1932360 RepID=UPI00156185D2|nr:hypothetical protein [Halorientalis sp. IM1011]